MFDHLSKPLSPTFTVSHFCHTVRIETTRLRLGDLKPDTTRSIKSAASVQDLVKTEEIYLVTEGQRERKHEAGGTDNCELSHREGAEKRQGVRADGKWREEESGGWLMVDGSSRMRVIIMTDVVYSHFPSHHLFCGGGEPTQSFFALQRTAVEARQAMS